MQKWQAMQAMQKKKLILDANKKVFAKLDDTILDSCKRNNRFQTQNYDNGQTKQLFAELNK